MSKKYALVIGNSEYKDGALPALKTPVQDAEALAAVLRDKGIGAFDEVQILRDATLQEMRLAVGQLFGRRHQPDDMLLLYFSGHGELDENDDLYLVARDTRRGGLLAATGLEAAYVTRYMNRARSRRQVIILDSCYSGAFGSGAKGQRVGTKGIFEGNGYGRYVLTASDALQLSWEGDRLIDGEIVNSFFTHFLVDGLRTGAADRNGDGYVDIDELYDHIHEGMMRASGKQEPLKFTFNEKGNLTLTRSPVSRAERERTRLTGMMADAEAAAQQGDYHRVETLLAGVIEADGDGFLGRAAKSLLDEIMVERSRATAYNDVKRLLAQSPRAAQAAWRTFRTQYPNYDPDNLAAQLAATPPRRKPAEAAQPQQQKSGTAKKPQLLRVEDILPAPFAWIEIPGASEGYSIAKYPLTNAQFAPFVEAGGYREKKWWTEAGWEAREQGWDWDSKENKWKPTGKPWTEPRYWQDDQWNGAEQPVVGVFWFEAVAYCLWLSHETGQTIMLPTEEQWQYAAQGDDGREYPWGNEWDCRRCNNSVKPCDSDSTTPVTHYEGKGDSPFGGVDMAGNVWEWCLTDYEHKTNDVNSPAKFRVLRGGSWNFNNLSGFRVSARVRSSPGNRFDSGGFRLALSL